METILGSFKKMINQSEFSSTEISVQKCQKKYKFSEIIQNVNVMHQENTEKFKAVDFTTLSKICDV